ncbi:hypothetical protein [Kitasatospora paranensis]|uniref:hypothetical protein n=1 Tax=Kitasatospora paranensis TaxID=258053 RepID=UPI0031E99E6A
MKTVIFDTSAASATSATETASKPRSTKSRAAAAEILARVCCFLRSRSEVGGAAAPGAS